MTTYQVTAQNKTYSVKVEYPLIVEADNELKMFVGGSLLTLMNVCALKGYSIEKLSRDKKLKV